MSAKLLDTCVLIDLVPGPWRSVDDRFSEAAAAHDRLMLSTISIFEFRYGVERSRRKDAQIAAMQRVVSVVEVVDFTEDDADVAARIKATLATRGRMIGPYDLLIAGQAMSRGWTLVTSNAREFARIDGLVLEDWRAPA